MRTLNIDTQKYMDMYQTSLLDPEKFWAEQANIFLTWYKKWDEVFSGDPNLGTHKWFEGGKLNVSYNCIDRHVASGYGSQVAFFWEDNDGDSQEVTYAQLQIEVCRFANVLRSRGVKKGDRVCIYLPMIPEALYAMLACARVGAVHTVVFGGFSSEALLFRIQDSMSTTVVTADFGKRGDKIIPLKARIDEILPACSSVHTVFVVQTTKIAIAEDERVLNYRTQVDNANVYCDPEWMEAEDPFFILYTSGSTGKPKGVLHTTGGYLLYVAMTYKYDFDYHEGDIYWCTADVGWITGHSYMVYGPLCNRATSVIFEGIPTYPDASRYWNIVDKYKVNIFYSTPTTIRMLMAQGDTFVTDTSRESLRILGTVGEPINPEAWRWYSEVVGNKKCTIVDTWWQTETGGHAIVSMPHVAVPKPGAAMLPFFGIEPVIVDEHGAIVTDTEEGILLLKGSWPGQVRDLYNDHERFITTYLQSYPGYYLTGDGAKCDTDGHFWITGRVDDTMNIAGRLIGTAEVENALVLHPSIAEAAVVAVNHPITGYYIHAYVISIQSKVLGENINVELCEYVKRHVGSFAKPQKITFVTRLPKTRSGKIMRRILRKIAQGEEESLGDTSTLAEPDVIGDLIATHKFS